MGKLDELEIKLDKLINERAKIDREIENVKETIKFEKDKKYFDLTYIMSENISFKSVNEIKEKIQEIIGKENIKSYEFLELKTLAHTIKENNHGFYAIVKFKQTEDKIALIEKELRTAKDILEFLTIRLDEIEYYNN